MLPRLLLPTILMSLFPGTLDAAPVSLKSIGTTCFESTLKNCRVTASGYVTPGHVLGLAYQIQTGEDEYGGATGGVVLYAQTEDGWEFLGADFAGAFYRLPRFTELKDTLIHIPGYEAGSSMANADILLEYIPENMYWRRVDIDSWQETVNDRLPEGLAIMNGVAYDFGITRRSQYLARTDLWAETDANCCPSGGTAEIYFSLEDGALRVSDVIYTEPEAE